MLTFILFASLKLFSFAAAALQEVQSPLGLSSPQHVLRPATEDDLDDIVTTFIDAFRPGPVWQYSYLDDDKYANYTWRCTRSAVQEQWKDLDPSTFVNVISVPCDDECIDSRRERVVSFAVWGWLKPEDPDFKARSFMSKLYASRGKCSDNLDVNVTRAEDVARQFQRINDKCYENITEPQLELGLIATHPDWDGNNFGAEQVGVGLAKAELADQPVTLIATPAGYPLYDSLGFRSVTNFTIEKLDNLGSIWTEYMRWDADESFS